MGADGLLADGDVVADSEEMLPPQRASLVWMLFSSCQGDQQLQPF